jgi:hypothetical protein
MNITDQVLKFAADFGQVRYATLEVKLGEPFGIFLEVDRPDDISVELVKYGYHTVLRAQGHDAASLAKLMPKIEALVAAYHACYNLE